MAVVPSISQQIWDMQIEGMAELTPRQLDVELGKLPPMAA
jgi:hypothetical protein